MTTENNALTPEQIAADAAAKAAAAKTAPEETVSRAEYMKARDDAERYRKQIEKAKADQDVEKAAKLREQNQHKELADKFEQELKEEREKNAKLIFATTEQAKFSALKDKCAALGIRPEAVADLEMLDLGPIQVETTSTGKTNILGADKFAERLKTLKPHWFADPKAPNVNPSNPRVIDSNTGPVTAEMIYAAEKEGRKSGDMSKYNEMFKKFQTQRAARH